LKFKRTVPNDDEGIPIVNLLIVFFMVSTVLSYDKGMGVKLPETASGSGQISNKGVSVLIDRDGKVFVDGQQVPIDQVGAKVKERQKVGGANVILKSDRDTRYQSIATVMDRLLEVGISDLSLPVVEKAGGQ
jgi:biopolymer transport protein ExbD